MVKLVNYQILEKMMKSIVGADRKLVLLKEDTPKDVEPDMIVAKDTGSRYKLYQPLESLKQITDVIPSKMKELKFVNEVDTSIDVENIFFGDERYIVLNGNKEISNFYQKILDKRNISDDANYRSRGIEPDSIRMHHYKAIYDEDMNRKDGYFISMSQDLGRGVPLDIKITLKNFMRIYDGPGSFDVAAAKIVLDLESATPAIKFNPGGSPVIKYILIKTFDRLLDKDDDPTKLGKEVARISDIYDYTVINSQSKTIPITVPEGKKFIYAFMTYINLNDEEVNIVFTDERGDRIQTTMSVLVVVPEISSVLFKCQENNEYTLLRDEIYSYYKAFDYNIEKWNKLMDILKTTYDLNGASLAGYSHSTFVQMTNYIQNAIDAIISYKTSSPNITDMWNLQEYKDAIDFVTESTQFSYYRYSITDRAEPVVIDKNIVDKFRAAIDYVLPYAEVLNTKRTSALLEEDPVNEVELRRIHDKIKKTLEWLKSDHSSAGQNNSALVKKIENEKEFILWDKQSIEDKLGINEE